MKKVSILVLVLTLSLSSLVFAGSFVDTFSGSVSSEWSEVYGAATPIKLDGDQVLDLAPGSEGGLVYKFDAGTAGRLLISARVDSYKLKFRLRDAEGEQLMRFFAEDDGDLKWQRFSSAHKADSYKATPGEFCTYLLQWDAKNFSASVVVDNEVILLGESEVSNAPAQFEVYSNNPGEIYIDTIKYTEVK